MRHCVWHVSISFCRVASTYIQLYAHPARFVSFSISQKSQMPSLQVVYSSSFTPLPARCVYRHAASTTGRQIWRDKKRSSSLGMKGRSPGHLMQPGQTALSADSTLLAVADSG